MLRIALMLKIARHDSKIRLRMGSAHRLTAWWIRVRHILKRQRRLDMVYRHRCLSPKHPGCSVDGGSDGVFNPAITAESLYLSTILATLVKRSHDDNTCCNNCDSVGREV